MTNRYSAVVFAAGFGTRLEGYKNPLDSKPLIKVNNKFLIQHLLTQIDKANVFDHVLVVGRKQIESLLISAISASNISLPVSYLNNGTYVSARQNLIIVKERLGDKEFALFNGHAPIPYQHIQQMAYLHKDHRCLTTTLYPHKLTRAKLTLEHKTNLIKNIIHHGDLLYDQVSEPYYGMGAPFFLNHQIVSMMFSDGFRYWYSHYYKKFHVNLWKIYGIISCFPPEADTKDELDDTFRYIIDHMSS